jgi:hypothetical protein
MFHLDYLSCFLTTLATVLVGRKSWTGLLNINCQQRDRTRNRLSHVSVWLCSSKPDLHRYIRIQHPVLDQADSHAPDAPSDGGDHGDDDGQGSLHSDRP